LRNSENSQTIFCEADSSHDELRNFLNFEGHSSKSIPSFSVKTDQDETFGVKSDAVLLVRMMQAGDHRMWELFLAAKRLSLKIDWLDRIEIGHAYLETFDWIFWPEIGLQE
jgi:hypothetical protein